MDQAAWHRSKESAEFENIRIFFQPSHSPKLNPVEHLWEHIWEKHPRNASWSSIEELEQELERILKKIAQSIDTIQKLTGFHWAKRDANLPSGHVGEANLNQRDSSILYECVLPLRLLDGINIMGTINVTRREGLKMIP